MASCRRRLAWVVTCVLILPALAGLSWITTETQWYSTFPRGSWDIIVVAEDTGSRIPEAVVEVPAGSWVPFDSHPGEVRWRRGRTDANGRLQLAIRGRPQPWGGTAHRLFWIWRIGPPRERPVGRLRISAEGFEQAMTDTEAILGSDGELVVRLRRQRYRDSEGDGI